MGREDRTLGLGGKQEPKATLKTDQKVDRDTDSIMAEKGNGENIPVTEKAPMPWDTTDWEQYHHSYNYMSYQKLARGE